MDGNIGVTYCVTPQQYNELAFLVLKHLNVAVASCSDLSQAHGGKNRLNLPALLFHELVIQLCHRYFLALEQKVGIYEHKRTDGSCSFAKVASGLRRRLREFANLGLHWFETKNLENWLDKNRKIISECDPRQTIFIATDLGANYREIVSRLQQHRGINTKVLDSKKGSKIFVPNADLQLKVLRSSLLGLEREIIELYAFEAIRGSINSIIDNMIKSYLLNSPQKPLRANAVLLGTLAMISHRFFAARAQAEGIPVAVLLHGEIAGVLDEPIFGYGELSFADVTIGYGRRGQELLPGGKYVKSLFENHKPKYIESSANTIIRIRERGNVSRLAELRSPRFMYIPTMFSGNLRYGPFRDVHDSIYLCWQQSILSELYKRAPGGVMRKGHPKDRSGLNPNFPKIIQIGGYLQEVLTKADVYVLDYFSSAFAIVAATKKPVIYIDIGLRNIGDSARARIQERCIFIDARDMNAKEAISRAFELADKQCSSNCVEEYSLGCGDTPREATICETLLRMVGKID